jgi:hypothetical protein
MRVVIAKKDGLIFLINLAGNKYKNPKILFQLPMPIFIDIYL